MSDVTEADLRAALIADIAATMPPPLGADEFTIGQWMHELGITVRSQAESQLLALVRAGAIERVPERRLWGGHLVWAYRKMVNPAE